MKGSVNPLVGRIPRLTPILNIAWIAIKIPTPKAINPWNNFPSSNDLIDVLITPKMSMENKKIITKPPNKPNSSTITAKIKIIPYQVRINDILENKIWRKLILLMKNKLLMKNLKKYSILLITIK